MARSKKDGRQGAGHRVLLHRKWKRLASRRKSQQSRRQQIEAELTLSREEEQAMLKELRDEMESDFSDYYDDFLGWGYDDSDHYEDDYYGDEYQYMESHWIDTVIYPEDKHYEEPEPDFNVFLAVDRAVRRHGATKTREQAHLLAAALNVSVFQIFTCISHTPSGYINSWT